MCHVYLCLLCHLLLFTLFVLSLKYWWAIPGTQDEFQVVSYRNLKILSLMSVYRSFHCLWVDFNQNFWVIQLRCSFSIISVFFWTIQLQFPVESWFYYCCIINNPDNVQTVVVAPWAELRLASVCLALTEGSEPSLVNSGAHHIN